MGYKSSQHTPRERSEHLLGRMTLEEKAAQLVQPFGWQVYEHTEGKITLTEDFKRQVVSVGIGSLYGMLRADQLPVYYNGKRSRGKRYLETDSLSRYPFGYGLSYTSFSYSDLRVAPQVILIKRHIQYIHIDPYANAFNESANDWHWNSTDITEMSPWVWERKFEIDSLCFVVRLAYTYWQETGVADFFDAEFKSALRIIIDLFKREQRHFEQSPYRFTRNNGIPVDSLRNSGLGMPVNYTGMIWSGFRPSDDACDFHYNIPGNMFAVVALRQMQEFAEWIFRDTELLAELKELEIEVDYGIKLYGIYRHPEFGPIYAYETDGFGNYCLMDDAGTPGLISIPYLGYVAADDPTYQNTRRFALSKENPFYYEGTAAKGIGSPHTPKNYIWHMALSMQGITARSVEEKLELITLLENTDADTGFMHEGFHADDPSVFTRSWFAWSNSLFSQFVYRMMKDGLL